jgi:hypothetical protein
MVSGQLTAPHHRALMLPRPVTALPFALSLAAAGTAGSLALARRLFSRWRLLQQVSPRR